jgi:MFS transporter, PAT family, beta-lactamase induction signal transducer AmpG
VLATVTGVAQTLGSLVGGTLSDRVGHRWALVMGTGVLTLSNAAFALTAAWWAHPTLVGAYLVVNGAATGITSAATLALYMDLTNPRVAATQFQLFMGLSNLRGTWATFLGGRLGDRMSAPAVYGLSALFDLLPLLLVRAMEPARARASYARAAAEARPDIDPGAGPSAILPP